VVEGACITHNHLCATPEAVPIPGANFGSRLYVLRPSFSFFTLFSRLSISSFFLLNVFVDEVLFIDMFIDAVILELQNVLVVQSYNSPRRATSHCETPFSLFLFFSGNRHFFFFYLTSPPLLTSLVCFAFISRVHSLVNTGVYSPHNCPLKR
jgi:formate hydrogenlyase subunit 4